MPLFSRFKNKGAQPTSKGKHYGEGANGGLTLSKPARWQSRWESTVVVPDEVSELVHVCTAEMKSRAEALDAPFLLLPFRPESDPQGARTFVRNYYKSNAEGLTQYHGEELKHQLRLTDSVVLCSILKWCWSRMPNGVVSWPVYEGFRIGEREANLARNAFDTFIPLGVDSDARRSIIFDFFDLLSAVAAHGKLNGLTGRKLSRLAGWWAFDHSDEGKGFEGGYRSWSAAADASSHLFFAYLRSLSPDTDPSLNVIERIPRSLQALVASTEYPPETPTLLQRSTPRVVMLVDSVSPTPFALLRRAKHFEYRDQDRILREFQEFEDPVDALTEECKRVLIAVSSANQSTAAKSRHGLAKPDESWTAFQSLGFADMDVGQKSPTSVTDSTRTVGQGLRHQPQSRNADAGRPTTPSWADFLSSGFVDDGSAKSPTLLYPPTHVLPPLGSRSSSPGPVPGEDDTLAPGELAAITNVELDDAFWWVWMISLAGEEPTERKGVFGRCALVETTIMNGRWLIMEEQVKGASPDPAEGAYIAPKKSFFSSLTKRGRLGRKRSTSKNTLGQPERLLSATPSKTSISTDREAKIKAAARALTRKQETPEPDATRRGRVEDVSAAKTNSVLTTGLQSEATPAMKWASAYDKSAIRAQYLGDAYAGKGMSREELVRKASAANINDNSNGSANNDRDLPAVPAESKLEPAVDLSENKAPTFVPESTRQQEMSALDKELGAGAGSSPVSVKVSRKPLPRSEDHPAHRQEEQTQAPVSPSQPNLAALAAQRALQSTTSTSPESTKNQSKLKKQPSTSNSGIKKLFAKRKEVSGRDSVDGQRPSNGGLSGVSENSVSRRLSLIRKKPGTTASPRASEPALPEYTHAGPEYSVEEPVITAADVHDHGYHPTADLSRSSTLDHQAADHEFSRFDQGPMDDMPGALPVDSPEPSPNPDQQTFDASRLHPLSHEDQPSFDAPASDAESEVTMEEDHHDAQVVRDRWATIRDNAQRRAAAHEQRPSEDQSTQSRFSHSQRTDDGETSGEETIESRVARIKARVAELTGNMDNAPRA